MQKCICIRRRLKRVCLMDFQMFGNADFSSEHAFAEAFSHTFTDLFEYKKSQETDDLENAIRILEQDTKMPEFALRLLFKDLKKVCQAADKPIVLMIDEVDSASENQVFVDFLAQLRSMYLSRDIQPAFKSVILAGVYDVKNLKLKIRSGEEHKYNSPWNIAADFSVDMSFTRDDIASMLDEYEKDHKCTMEVKKIAY